MKLISATVKNFRLLKDVHLDFSTDKNKPLTVIRAANETGKTTLQHALVWGLYGSQALPGKGQFTLFPADLIKTHKSVEVSVEIEFEDIQVERVGRSQQSYVKNKYKLTRTCIEKPSENEYSARRDAEQKTLFKITDTGSERILESEISTIIERALPLHLKDVYFTDGDSAMSFIEASATDAIKRKRVQSAVQSLLGLNIVEDTIRHLTRLESDFSSESKKSGVNDGEIDKLNDIITSCSEDIEEWETDKEEAQKILEKASMEKKKVRGKIDEILKKGNKEELVNERNKLKMDLERRKIEVNTSYASLAKICYGNSISRALLATHLQEAKENLQKLSDKKQLPKVHVPVLEELLTRELCFCGESLESASRRESIKKMIYSSQEADRKQEAASDLFYRIRSIDANSAENKWKEEYTEKSDYPTSLQSVVTDISNKLKDIDEKVSQINDVQLDGLKSVEAQLQKTILAKSSEFDTKTQSIKDRAEAKVLAERKLNQAMNKLGKHDKARKKWTLTNLTKQVFVDLKNKLTQDELQKVSSEMNRIFLAMIGMNSEVTTNQARITKAELTDKFDIKVYSQNNHELNPDIDLNGASRRAITLSFILALTKVSGVEAPNIIDTPLGMMSGYVKQSVLLNTIKEGAQSILFLTHDEIRGVEDILDRYSGRVFTLTNPAHYPIMLNYKPADLDSGIIRCECNHHETCEVCSRKNVEVA